MSGNSNTILRIFQSSTAIDLQEHRQKVAEAILRLGDLPVTMETFGAMPSISHSIRIVAMHGENQMAYTYAGFVINILERPNLPQCVLKQH